MSGANQFVIAPKVGGKFTYAKCEYNSIYGKVLSEWHKENDYILYKIVIPTNTSAKVILCNEEKVLPAGKYEFRF